MTEPAMSHVMTSKSIAESNINLGEVVEVYMIIQHETLVNPLRVNAKARVVNIHDQRGLEFIADSIEPPPTGEQP